MDKDSRFVGLDVHAETIAVGVAEPGGEVRSLGTIPNTPEAVRRLVKKLGPRHRLGKFLLRQGRRAPTGSKAWGVKHRAWLQTIRFAHAAQDATLLDYRTEIDHAADRIVRLERAIATAADLTPAPVRAVIAGLQALRGIAKLSAVSVVTEVGALSRFAKPRQLMGYSGAVASEHSSGPHRRRGGITKTGNAHLRRIVIEAAWAYRHRPAIGGTLRTRQEGLSEEVKALAWKAQHRLHGRYTRLLAKGKAPTQVVTAIARELLGFIWAIGVHIEQHTAGGAPAAA